MDNISSMGNFGIDNKVANLVRCYNKRDRLILVAVLRSGWNLCALTKTRPTCAVVGAHSRFAMGQFVFLLIAAGV